MRYWAFDINTCHFERASKETALRKADIAVVNDGSDVLVIQAHHRLKRWPTGETLIVAGAEFEREQFE
jgi:hypothetical protein